MPETPGPCDPLFLPKAPPSPGIVPDTQYPSEYTSGATLSEGNVALHMNIHSASVRAQPDVGNKPRIAQPKVRKYRFVSFMVILRG